MCTRIPCSWKQLLLAFCCATFVFACLFKDILISGMFSRVDTCSVAVTTNVSLVSSRNNWNVAQRQTTKDCWPWKICHNPRLVVVVRWYIKQELYPLLATLNSAAGLVNETIAVWIVDIKPIPVNTPQRGKISYQELMRQISACSAVVPWLRVQGLMPPALPPTQENLYGYGQVDWVLKQLHDLDDWDHILFTNGDNTYSRYLLAETLDARRFGYALIGFDFVHHQEHGNIPSVLVTNMLQSKHSDLGSMIFHRGVVGRPGENCFCGLTFREASRQHGLFVADSGLMISAQRCSRRSQIVIHEVLFHHE